MSDRRDFLRHVGAAALGGGLLGATGLAGQQQEPLAGQGETGALRDPGSAGQPRTRVSPSDNDEFIKAVEYRLRCTCGCTLDIYTCRTTDFTCTYSPELHREILALHGEGKNADEIIQAFVAKYGEKVLMAPKPEGFNIAGYVVPGITVLVAGSLMALILWHRVRSRQVAVSAAEPVEAAPVPANVAAGGASPDELERLRRELRELDS